MRKIVLSYVILIFIIIGAGFLGCNGASQFIPDNMPTYEEFVANHDFPYIAPVERQNHLIQNYYSLSEGMAKAEVIQRLGNPDFSQPMYSKAPSPGYLGTDWTYFLEKQNPNIANLKDDKSINVFFDTHEKTKWVVSNIKGLNEIGEPNNDPENCR